MTESGETSLSQAWTIAWVVRFVVTVAIKPDTLELTQNDCLKRKLTSWSIQHVIEMVLGEL